MATTPALRRPPKRLPKLVERAVRAGWSVGVDHSDPDVVTAVFEEHGGQGYTFTLTWEREATYWRSEPRTAAAEVASLTTYLDRLEGKA